MYISSYSACQARSCRRLVRVPLLQGCRSRRRADMADEMTQVMITEAMASAEKVACRSGDDRCYRFPDRVGGRLAGRGAAGGGDEGADLLHIRVLHLALFLHDRPCYLGERCTAQVWNS